VRYKQIIKVASHRANTMTMAQYDQVDPGALRRLVGAGTQLRSFSQDVMEVSLKAAMDVYAEISVTNADLKTLLDHTITFHNEQYLWH
jgi:TRAP-type mannitol/chloroaromatic compound transport system substrate-binding protein